MQSLTEISPMTTARAAFASAVHESNIYVCGGVDQDEKSLSSIEFLETTNHLWTVLLYEYGLDVRIDSSCVAQDKFYVKSNNEIICFDFSTRRCYVLYDVSEYSSFVFIPFDQISLKNCLKNAPKPKPIK